MPNKVACVSFCHCEYPIARGALIEPRKNREVACAVRTTDLFMSSAVKNLMVSGKDETLRYAQGDRKAISLGALSSSSCPVINHRAKKGCSRKERLAGLTRRRGMTRRATRLLLPSAFHEFLQFR